MGLDAADRIGLESNKAQGVHLLLYRRLRRAKFEMQLGGSSDADGTARSSEELGIVAQMSNNREYHEHDDASKR